MEHNDSQFISLTAIMSGLVTVVTALIVIPFPTSTGYLNFGDTMVMLSGMLLGPIGGFIAGGVGSALADIARGYLGFAPLTFIVKGFEGLVVGMICRRVWNHKKITPRDVVGLVAGGIVMMLGYFLGEIVLLGYEVAIAELIFLNWIQALVGIVFTVIVGPSVRSYLAQTIPGNGSISDDYEFDEN